MNRGAALTRDWAPAAVVLAAAAAVYVARAGGARQVEREIQRLGPLASAVTPASSEGAGAAAGGGRAGAPPAGRVPRDPSTLYAEVIGPFEEKFAALGRTGLTEALDGADEAVAALGPDELVALLENDPGLTCSKSYPLAATPDDEVVRAGVLVRALRRLFDTDPVRALELAVSSGAAGEAAADVELHNLVWRALADWAQDDFAAASAWLDGQEAGLYLGDLKRFLMLQGVAETGVATAVEKAADAGLLDDALPYISRSVRPADLPAFFAAVATLPEVGAFRWQYYRDFAIKVNNSQGWEAAQRFVEAYATGREHAADLATAVATADPHGNPAAKTAWVAELSPASERDANVSEVVTAWTTTDPAGVAAWLGLLGDEPWRDAAQAAFERRLSEPQPR
jgi:hypothetical protein